MKELNKMELKFKALSQNESFARASVAGFCMSLNPTMDELTDIKTAVSEAVTNCIVHAYPTSQKGEILITTTLYNSHIKIEIRDFGIGIKDIEQAKRPFFSTAGTGDRSGMGFTIMESFMDSLVVKNEDKGVLVTLTKAINSCEENILQLG
jgi:stage II sporulation protein AB (anti-sigma F factor)